MNRLPNSPAVALAVSLIALPTPLAANDDVTGDVQRYCTNIADAARERRYAVLDGRIAAAREALEAEREALVARTTELRDWIERREAFLALADERLVAIYAAMRADAAAEQMVLIEPMVAAAVLVRLKPRQASAVLADMPGERAAAIASIIAASKERTRDTDAGEGA